MSAKGLALIGGLVALGWSAPALGQEDTEQAQAREIEKDLAEVAEDPVKWGVGLRLRYVVIPKFLLEQFWEEVATGPANPGFGVDVVRKRGDDEFSFGFEYESLSGDEGFWLEKGDDAVSNGMTPDLVEFDGFSWLTIDASFVFHKPLHEKFALRYGGGFGLGILFGEVTQTDATCSSRNINDPGVCMENPGGGQVDDPVDIPPVFPVINLIFGGQLRPIPDLAINFEVGLRTAFYTGVGAQYMF